MSSTIDERKPVIPSKSSLEILSELFSTFDAEPPVIVKKEKAEDSSKKHKKSKKKRKDKHRKHKKKSKKRKRSRSSGSSGSESSGIDLTDLLLKGEVERTVKTEPKASVTIKRDTEHPEAGAAKKPKNDQSASSSSDNDSNDESPAAEDAKFSSIFHVALQTLQEREKLKREQLISAKEASDTKPLEDEHVKIEHNIKMEVDASEDPNLKELKAEPNLNKETNKNETCESSQSNDLENNSSQDKDKSPDATESKDSKVESTAKSKISPIRFAEVISETKTREVSKRKETYSSKSRDKDGRKSVYSRDGDSQRKGGGDSHRRDGDSHRKHSDSHRKHGDSHRKHGDSHRRDGDSHRRNGDSHRRDTHASHHRDGKSSSQSHNDRDRKRRHGDRQRDDDDFYRKKEEPNQGNLVSTRLGNPFYRNPNESRQVGEAYYFLGSKSPPSTTRPSKEDRWSIRERFRRQATSESSSGGSIGIDKKKLLEIARKNAVQMIKSGSLPEALKLGTQAQEKVIAAIRSGGKTVDELTDFCRTISRKEEMGELSSLSDGEERTEEPESEADQPFHHPFQLRERPQSITVNIKNAAQLPIKASTDKPAELHLQFPVSSGQLHRKTESQWTPVEPPAKPVTVAPQPKPQAKKDVALAAIGAANQAQTAPAPSAPPKPTPKPPITTKPAPVVLPPPPPAPPSFLAAPMPVPPVAVYNPLPAPPAIHPALIPLVVAPPPPPPPPMMPPPSPPPMLMTMVMDQQPPVPGVGQFCDPQHMVGPTMDQLAEQRKLDVAAIVAQRLTAMRKLQENPNDVQAISQIYKSQKEMNFWAECKQQFGQFTGSTGAQIMSQAELNSGYQAWARRDQLQTAAPVTGGMGMHLLQKMGWRPGEGLGKEKSGALEPLLLEVKLDKKGVVAKEEVKGGRGRGANANKAGPSSVKQVVKAMQGKHPVSLLSEYASKRHLGAPVYSLCFECGPDHKKNFVFKVMLNGVEYKPDTACGNKKEAKAHAAQLCLQQIGMLPHVPISAAQQGLM